MQCVIAGSYRKFYEKILHEVMPVFDEAGINVKYPPRSRIVNPEGDFPIFESDITDVSLPSGDLFEKIMGRRNIETLSKDLITEIKFLEAGLNSSFIYIYNPGGYIGYHTDLELGYFGASNIPIYAFEPIDNQNWEEIKNFVSTHGWHPNKDKLISNSNLYTSKELEMFDKVKAFCFGNGLVLDSKGGFYKPSELVDYLQHSCKL